MTRNVYSPSAGNVCTTEMPPRVPHGVPSMCFICDCGARNLERRLGRAGVAIAERDGRNLRRRPEVAFEQRRRHALHVGDVVEAGAHRVGRQEGVDVDVEIEELADGARVLGAIEALEHPATGVRVQQPPRCRCGFRAPPRASSTRPRPGAARRAAASCRRAACGSSSRRLPRGPPPAPTSNAASVN